MKKKYLLVYWVTTISSPDPLRSGLLGLKCKNLSIICAVKMATLRLKKKTPPNISLPCQDLSQKMFKFVKKKKFYKVEISHLKHRTVIVLMTH